MAHDLRPFRDYDEKDVINLYSYNATPAAVATLDDAGTPLKRGLLVKIDSGNGGWDTSQELNYDFDTAGSNTITNTVSPRYGVKAQVVLCGDGERPIGMMLHDVRERDENGEQLKFNPRKAAEMEAVLAGQAVPIVTRGVFLYESDADLNSSPAAGEGGGSELYCDAAGEITDDDGGSDIPIGRTLGNSVSTTNAAGSSVYHTLIKLEL